MKKVIRNTVILFVLLMTFTVQSYAQSVDSSVVFLKNQPELKLLKLDTENAPSLKPENSTLPLALGIVIFLYLLNPMLLVEDGLAVGMTKELSLGFGDFGQYRLGAEYSFIFRSLNKSQLRFSGNYDILTKDIEPSNLLQTTGALSLGGGYFTDFDSDGFFGQAAYGFSIRNDKMLIFPHVKARYTVIPTKNRNNIFDLSFGVIIGLANPFIDLNIRRKH